MVGVLNENNPWTSFNKKAVTLSYPFAIERVDNDVVEVC